MCSSDVFLGLLAILFPPLAVWVKRGICSADSLINILLCVLGFIPGLLHAWYIIAKFPDHEWEGPAHEHEAGRVAYVYVQPSDSCRQPRPHGGMDYGTQGSSRTQRQAEERGVVAAGSGSNHAGNSRGVPPSYAEVVAGDHKVQTNE
ncbi:Plasma membrane proteolipid 3 [Ophiocordyceps camponoti-floridani]|uniref:Plasma membrane proteolipid 3 n=1 Tax=Ophiocordyceps camponoti-floridani TaxID=2030778 RepID=A0A8H4Q3B3_9HYPO|nr:Plasma membrane proteolipid 3 [Ophiocordyceps camponoti-floridani]